MPAALDGVVLAVAPSGPADSYDRTYPPAARAALALARASGAQAVIYTSSTGVYGGRDGAWMTEASPRAGDGPGNAALRAAEDALQESGMPGVTVLRVAGIYGPGRDPRGRFVDSARLPMRGEYWVNMAHQHDIVAAIVGSVEHAGPPRVLNVADGTPTRAADIARWLAAVRGADPAALAFTDSGAPSRSNQRIANAALVATGWRARYPSFREGFTSGL
jgi:nucleoside-diphosphate-sugar epimerase